MYKFENSKNDSNKNTAGLQTTPQPIEPASPRYDLQPSQPFPGCQVTRPIDLVFLVDSMKDEETFQDMKNWMVAFMNDLNPTSFQVIDMKFI